MAPAAGHFDLGAVTAALEFLDAGDPEPVGPSRNGLATLRRKRRRIRREAGGGGVDRLHDGTDRALGQSIAVLAVHDLTLLMSDLLSSLDLRELTRQERLVEPVATHEVPPCQ